MSKRVPRVKWGDNDSLEKLMNHFDLSRLPYETKVRATFPRQGHDVGDLKIYVSVKATDRNNKRRKVTIGFVERLYLQSGSPGSWVSGQNILAFIRTMILKLFIHEVDESVRYNREIIWDPHTRKGRNRAKLSF